MKRKKLLIMLPVLALVSQACVVVPGFVPIPRELTSCDLLWMEVNGQLDAIASWDFDAHSDAELQAAWARYEMYANDWANAGCAS